MEMNEKRYAIVDAAVEESLFDLFEKHNPPNSCLYSDPDNELAKVAPYLLEVTPPVQEWFDKKTELPWGFYFTSKEKFISVRQHLKKYLQVKIPIDEKPVFLRFYDPRVIWRFISILNDWELHQFMGPMDKIITNYHGIREGAFVHIREQYPKDSKRYRPILTLSNEQYNKLEQQELVSFHAQLFAIVNDCYDKQQEQEKKEDRYHFRIVDPLMTTEERKPLFMQLCSDLIEFCQRYKIDEESAKIIASSMINDLIYHISDVPPSWHKRLSNPNQPSHYNVKVLTTLLQQKQEVR